MFVELQEGKSIDLSKVHGMHIFDTSICFSIDGLDGESEYRYDFHRPEVTHYAFAAIAEIIDQKADESGFITIEQFRDVYRHVKENDEGDWIRNGYESK